MRITDHDNRKEERKMKKFVATLGLGLLLLGGFGACGNDSGTPIPDAAGPDGGKAGGDGGGSSEAGHSTYDGGDKSEANPASPADAGGRDSVANVDVGIVNGGPADVGNADVAAVADAPSNPDQAADSISHVVVVDGGTDAPGLLDTSADGPAVIDVGRVDAGSAVEVGIDSLGVIDGSGLSLLIPEAGERFSPPLPNANSLPSGVWYCDMGTVHWAQGEKGAGTCPICGMNLVQRT
jgi:hypothetical protein